MSEIIASTVKRATSGQEIEVVTLRGRLDAASAPDLREEFREFIESGHNRIVLDFAAVNFIDSSGISVIITLLKAATSKGGDVVLTRLTPQVRTILELTRLYKVFRIHETVEAACESFAAPAR